MTFKEYMAGALTKPMDGDTVEYFKIKGRVSGNVLTNAQQNIPAPFRNISCFGINGYLT